MVYPDLSHYNPVTDWAAVKRNCPFLISKATQGTDYIDPYLFDFIRGCEENRIPYWLYVFLNRGNETAQTAFLLATCKERIGAHFCGYILDVEMDNTAADVRAALQYLQKNVKKTMLYTMYAEYERYAAVIRDRPSSCAWWEARYGDNDGTYDSAYPCHAGADLHQYTDRGTCPGIDGETDLNRLTGEKPERWFTTLDDSTEEGEDVTYRTLEDVPEWYRPTIEKLIQDGSIRGVGEGILDLSEDVCRTLTILDRHGVLKL